MSKEDNNWLLFSTRVIQYEIAQRQEHILNNILNKAEAEHLFCLSCEVIDVNRCKILYSQHHVKETIYQYYNKPFVFIFCKN
ncbi:MAG: hypothetical protein KF781_06140 [Chitinophagaceae bacterium]|nr:hypothetical protein [Chitinophagaceae bacterium]MCW5906024.1 hypothetical protein [Chitinophagaceae bacterium]